MAENHLRNKKGSEKDSLNKGYSNPGLDVPPSAYPHNHESQEQMIEKNIDLHQAKPLKESDPVALQDSIGVQSSHNTLGLIHKEGNNTGKDMVKEALDIEEDHQNVILNAPNKAPVEHVAEEVKLDEEGNGRKQRFFGGERPKTYSNTFGSVEDFLQFFETRSPEIANFAKLFKQSESSQDSKTLNQHVLPALVDCIKMEAAKQGNGRGRKKLLRLFTKLYITLQEFYADILKAYTLETFLYHNLNEYLRNEDWIQLDCLLPYAFCLCKAFLSSELASNASIFNNEQPIEVKETKKSITLYRGARFDEASLSCYNIGGNFSFSWNAVTSTSTNRNVAEHFRDTHPERHKTAVMFIIEVAMDNDHEKNANLFDISPFSVVSEEAEIVLAPGSIFEVISFNRSQEGVEIKLRLVSDVSEIARQGKIMYGTMRTEVSKETISKIIGLEGKELTEALYHLKGNRVIDSLEFTICNFDRDSLRSLIETLPSLRNLTDLKLFSVVSEEMTYLSIILNALSKLNVQTLQISDRTLSANQHADIFAKVLGSLTSLTSLTLEFIKLHAVTDRWVKITCFEGIRHLTSLTSLDLNFSGCCMLTDESLNSLGPQGIKELTSLKSLILNFKGCWNFTDKGLDAFCFQGLVNLTQLKTLNLNFEWCNKITNEGLETLIQKGIRHLVSLTSLSLDFSACNKITDQGLDILCSQDISSLNLLNTIYLNFTGCNNITDEGLITLSSGWITNLPGLTTLTIKTTLCQRVTDKGREMLKAQANLLKPSLNVTTINLVKDLEIQVHNFKRGSINKGLRQKENKTKALFSNPRAITTLDSATKVVDFYEKMESEEQPQQLFKSLKVDYKPLVRELSVEEVNCLFSEWIRKLTCLETLNVDFSSYSMTNEVLKDLCSEGIRHLTSLTTLNLNLSCNSIADDGISVLCTQGIRHLRSLTTLTLNFSCCAFITDEGLNSLCSQGIRYLTSLTSLNLNLMTCPKISGIGLRDLKAFLKYFGWSSFCDVDVFVPQNFYPFPLNMKP